MRVVCATRIDLDSWSLRLSCGHTVTVVARRMPSRRISPCTTCLADAIARIQP
jgi:hypothetical protein